MRCPCSVTIGSGARGRERRAIVLQELAVEPNLTVREVLSLGEES